MKRGFGTTALAYAFLLVCTLFALLPFAWMLLTAFRTQLDLNSGSLVPHALTFENFIQVWQTVPVLHYLLNSVLVTGSILVVQIITSVLAGYGLVRMRNQSLSRAMVWVVLGATMIPVQVIALPMFLGLSRIGVSGTLGGLILPFLASAFGIYLFRQFFLQFPTELLEASRLDGAGETRTLLRIVLPLARPTIVAFSVFSVTAHWNDFFWPFLTLRGNDAATIPYAVAQFASNESGSNFPLQMAAAALAIVPMVFVFLVMQRQFQTSLLSGAVR